MTRHQTTTSEPSIVEPFVLALVIGVAARFAPMAGGEVVVARRTIPHFRLIDESMPITITASRSANTTDFRAATVHCVRPLNRSRNRAP
jgi:hypothetical protein